MKGKAFFRHPGLLRPCFAPPFMHRPATVPLRDTLTLPINPSSPLYLAPPNASLPPMPRPVPEQGHYLIEDWQLTAREIMGTRLPGDVSRLVLPKVLECGCPLPLFARANGLCVLERCLMRPGVFPERLPRHLAVHSRLPSGQRRSKMLRAQPENRCLPPTVIQATAGWILSR
jgi:hypothetical protein